jgi:hypothetical protein
MTSITSAVRINIEVVIREACCKRSEGRGHRVSKGLRGI